MDRREKIEEAARLISQANEYLQMVMGEMDAIEDFAIYKRGHLRLIAPKKGENQK